ncbi:centromere-associated protein E-like [Hetaerina americana]|uniref:centromere-associated protein E-like n=1 Tax=Hetaerina americana TaxID=62018 RepID=UPI003A7F6210
MASGADQRIKVGIRVRKLTRKEKDQNKQLQWKYSDNQVWQIDPQTGKKAGNPYTFDYVFGMDSSTHNIFEDLVKPIVESSVKGFNGTIFAYGQTSSGKTYTMLGEKSEEGIIPLSVNHVFTTAEKNSDRGYFIRVSYMEIYNEKIHDLLEVQNNLKIHEDSSGTAYVALKEEVVDCPEKVLALMKKGEKTRRFGVTDINERSSRSHTIFRITIESRKQRPDLSTNEHLWDDAVIESHLNLIDLAGSERVFQTKATGDRFKEGCAINKSLFHLGKVISQLSEGSGQYVNFRDSKLTRILESSLGGNAHTAIICTVTPASVEETASTFSFASRAIRITNTPHLNEIVSDECLIRRHAALVKKLELELEKAKQDNDCESMKKELEQKEKIICRLKDWIKRDELQAHSPCLVPRSDRRKTWAASDLAASLQLVKSSQDLNPLNEEEFGSGSMLVDSPFFESEKASEFGRRGRSCSGLWNKENLPLQEVRLSLQSPIFEGNGKELKRGSHGGGKKRKNAATKEKKKKCDSEILFSDSKSCSNLKNETSNMLNSSVENAEITVKINIQSLEASLEKEKLKVESLEESLETERLKVESLEESLEKEKFKVESLEESLEKEKLKVELLESALKKQTIEVEQLVFKEKELLSKIEENEANALSEKRALLNAFENMLDKKDNNHEIDLLNKVESCKEIANNLKIKLHESDAVIHSLTSKQDELKSALKMEKLRSNKASKELKNVLECISSLTGDLARLTGKSDDMELVVNDEAKSIEEKGVFHSKVAIMDLNKVIEEMKSFYMKEILELIKQAEGLSVMTMGMGEEISTLKIHFGKLVVESNEIKAERNEFESLLNIEKENINSLQAQLQSSYEHGISLSQQVSELLETLKKTEAHLSFMTKSNLEAETDLLTYSSRINELEEELQASEVVIANLAESDEDNLVELQEVAKEKDKLKDQLVEAYENVKSLLAEVKNMSENSIPSESLDALKSDCLQLSSECESYKVQLNEMKGAYVELEERNRQILEEKSLLMKEKDVVLAEFEQMKIAHSRWSNELRDALQKAECELLSLGKEKEILALDLTTEKDKNECMRNNMDKVAGENESLLKELEGLRQACDNESGHLEVISSLQKELDQIKFSISVCTESEKELDRLLALEKEKTQSLNNQLNKFDAEKEEMMLKCDQLQNLIYELKNIQRLGEEENAELENNISKLRSSNDKLTQKIHSLEVKCETISELESHITMLNEKMNAYINEINAGKVTIIELQGDLNAAQDKLLSETANLREISEELMKEKLKEMLLALESAHEKLKVQNEEAAAEKENHEKIVSSLRSQLEEADEKFELILKQKEEKIISLVKEFEHEVEKLNCKVHETESLISTKSDVEARLEEVSAEKMKLQEQLELAEEKMENLRNDVAAELGNEKSSYEQNIASLQKQLQDTTDEFELILKEREGEISALEHELQQEVEKLSVKVQETEALISTKSDVEARLEEVSAEKMKLQEQLELSEEKMQNLRNDVAAELGTEKSSHEQNIASLREQLQDSTDVFELILKQKEEKISALEHELHQEVEKLSVKVQETEALISTKSDVEARLEEVSAEKMKLQEQLELAEEKMQNLRNDVAAELGTEKSSYEQNIASLQKQLQDTTDEFELILKQKEEKISALEHELQQEVEKLSVKVQETEALISTKSDVEARLEEVSAEKVKLQEQLELSEEKMQNLRNDMAAELGTEKSSYEQNIASLQKQLQDTTDEFELILKQKEEKISALEHELQQEVEKLSVKVQETEALISTKSDVEARLEEVSAEKMKLQEQLELSEEKMQNLRNDVAAELGTEKSSYEQNIASLQKQLQDTTDEFELILKQKEEKISALEHELQQEVEKLSVKVQETEALISTKSDVEARLEEVSAEKVKLQEQLELSEEKMQNLRNDMAAELGTEKSSYEQNIASLQKQLQDTTDEFELILKQKEEKISALEHELQQEVEKLSVKVQETEALISSKSDVEARLEDVSAEKMKLQEELELAEEKMQNLRNDVEAELGTEKSSYEQNIASLQKQLQDAQEEFKLNLNQKDKIIASLESNINSEIMKYNDKIKECTHLECQKKELENQIEYFSQQEQKYLATERKLVTEEIRIEMLQKRLDELQVTYTASVDELNRLKCTEHDLQSDLEKIRKHNCELDNACKLAKTDLSSAQSDCAKLQSEVNVLKCKLQEESTNNQQLSVQLNIEQEGHLAARAAEEKILGVIASQDKIISVCENTMSDLKQKLKSESENCSDLRVKCQNLESKLIDIESAAHAELSQLKQENENLIEKLKGFHADHSQKPSEYLNALQAKDEQLKELENKMTEAVKERESLVIELARRHEECQTLEANLSQMKEQLIVLNGTISKNQEELNEFKEKYNERDEYSKRMDQWAVKMEKRLKITEDYRLEVQQKAKAVEADLRLKINELKTEKEGLEYQAMKPEPAKCNCLQFERDLKREKEEKEALRLKVDECNRMLSYGGKYESAHSKRLEMRESSVQTTTVEVVDIDPNGCGVVQICQVDYLNKLVNKLKKDKEDLKQICRRRHNQREDLKLEVNELKVKLKSLETQAHKS